MARIGFVGLGHMGLPMAVNLVKAGHCVTGFDINPVALNAFKAAHGSIATSLHDVAADNAVIISMLQTGSHVKQVWLGAGGLLLQAARGSLLIDCSSIDVASARLLHDQAKEKRLLCVDAPVSGGVSGASAGTLTFLVGGNETAFQTAKPILDAMGQTILHTGPAGTGQAAKMCNNMILGISMAAISEAFVLAEALGLTPKTLFDVVSHASGQCWAMSHYAPVPNVLPDVPANHQYQPGFTAAMMLKDLNLSQEAALSYHITTPVAARATALYQQMHDDHMGGLDFSAIIKLISNTEYDV